MIPTFFKKICAAIYSLLHVIYRTISQKRRAMVVPTTCKKRIYKIPLSFREIHKKLFCMYCSKVAKNRTNLGLTGLVQSVHFSVQKQIKKREQDTW